MGGKSHPHLDSIPDLPARSSVAIPTELPGPHIDIVQYFFVILFIHYSMFRLPTSIIIRQMSDKKYERMIVDLDCRNML